MTIMDAQSSKLFKGDCEESRISHVTGIMDLHIVIMVDILSRLPIKSIFYCKIVCKLWYHLLTSDPLFCKMYYKRSSYFPSILLSINHSVRLLVELKDDVSHPLNRTIVLSPRFHLPPTLYTQNLTVISSCNGFICLFNGSRDAVEHSVYISNPLLGEYFEVKLPKWEKRIQRVAYAFCFSETSGQYKVLRSVVSKFEGCPHVSELEVYTLGVNEKCRNVGEVPEPLCRLFCKANVNGVVHWMTSEKNDSIYSFNSWTEEVKSMLAPRGLTTSSYGLTLVELENCLCLCDTYHSEYIDIWWMKEYGIAESWTKDRIWKDTIQPDINCDRFIPISTWKDGEILMQRYRGTHVVSYNPKENKFTKVKVYLGFAGTSYIPSFYSLKTVIGESLQVSYAYSKIEIV
ncbi:hypothetical protein KY290_014326 [Solanum tuberosum]|uniref:F-box domain-containing protein n=1 Tax=Solanum tuberosum TaxID=4113 RepID=A0ABQ7VPZ1_SOLTU|nr:hypothetical protein KY289_014386 [Solanum tuberosum]KAH0699511.1 hypothetical protein KY284_013726 [Solanum tuberosum]KAH0770345.1 hypothetical protein KY290_014326 [Solanum tuberosum]